MKKIFLVVIFLFISVETLFCDEYDMNRIIPQKLIRSELPEDYPRELDELFIFYWDTVHLFSENYSKEIEDRTTLIDYIDTIELSKRYRLIYLLWLARNVIPEYYSEYYTINRNPMELISRKILSQSEIDSLAICPTVKKKNGKIKSIITLFNVNYKLWLSVSDTYYLRNSLINPVIWPIWVRAQVTDEWWKEGKVYINIVISNALGMEFDEDQIEVEVLMSSSKTRHYYEIGEEYLINLGYRMAIVSNQNNNYPKQYITNHRINYLSQQHRTYLIQNNNIVIPFLFQQEIFPEILSKPGIVSYDKILDNFNNSMDKLKETSNE